MLRLEKIGVDQLRIGMFVSELDRPWLGTPFLLQGFEITTEDEISQLRDLCSHVFIDITQPAKPYAKMPSSSPRRSNRRDKRTELLRGRAPTRYVDQKTLYNELPAAQEALQTLGETVRNLFQVRRADTTINVAEVKAAVEPMVNSIRRNPDACIWLSRLRQQDDYTYQHSVACSVWSVALGRQLSLPQEDLNSLALGGLLLDIGKLNLDPELFLRPDQLTPEEWVVMQTHVGLGIAALEGTGVNRDVLDMIQHHHERFDGSGYPSRLKGDEIPVFGRIAAVIDTFDAMTSQRVYARAISPSEAIHKLNKYRDTTLQAEIVDEFIQAIGVYPAGTIVELSSGEIAVVVAEGRVRRLRPTVTVLLDADKLPVDKPYVIDLRERLNDGHGKPLDIKTSLPSDAYGIDIADLTI
ncbi:HD-GYP domain protein [Luminiphilus syltensis NOR5-1B]|uniref:HD-GYP domain protein n=1 Tax=Luminiphilus syltensis NOR5-1B TaxID=565045 RepID=B8KXF2_9GAMM|nr:HD-GYP domain-containing protein [Luminiphilus syltensis]EED36641.1 HD-GYP domain protein [Luminiphilus syltensis NOR5-1B]